MTRETGSEGRFQGDLPSSVDVVVVGGGIAGTSAAYHLARAGVPVLLLERDRIGGGTTAAAVGVLSPPMRQPFHETVRFRGEAVARTIWEFALRSVQGMARVLQEHDLAEAAGLDMGGGYVLAEPHTLHQVEESARALERAGLPVSWLSVEDVRNLTPGRGFPGGYRIDGLGAVDPGGTARALAQIAAVEGALVREEIDVAAVERRDGRLVCRCGEAEVACEMVVYATHVDSRRFSSFLGDEIVPIRGQGMVAETSLPAFRGAFATHWKLNVWRNDARGRLVIGGWRHDAWDRSYWKMRPEVDEDLQRDVQSWFESAFPAAAPLNVLGRWSGIFGWTADYLPLVGPLPGRTGELVISGFSGGGLPFAFESGRLIASIVSEGDPVPGSDLLNPRRFT